MRDWPSRCASSARTDEGHLRASSWARALLVAVTMLASAPGARGGELVIVGAPPLVVHAPADRVRVAADLAARGPSEIRRISEALGLPAPERIDCYLLHALNAP